MFLIKSDDQRQKTAKRIEEGLAQVEKVKKSYGPEKAEAYAKVMQRHLDELKEQIRIYNELKEKGLGPLHPQHLSEVGLYLVKARVVSDLTQADLAKKLGVSQPMVFKYENSEYQGADLEMLTQVANALGLSLNLEAFCQPGSKGYDPKRQEAAILFFAREVNNTFLGKTKLMKLLYYADYERIQEKGVSITGDAYVAMPYGPMPRHGEDALKRLEKAGALRIEDRKVGDRDQKRCIGLKEPDLSLFTSEEIERLYSIARRFEFWTATQMSNLTHEDWPWQSTELGHEIALYRVSEK